jgi:hypothetical protein
LDEQSIVDMCHPLTEGLLLGGHFGILDVVRTLSKSFLCFRPTGLIA